MKLIFNFGVIIFVFSCSFGCSFFGYQSQDYEKIADKITERSAKKLKAQKGLVLIGTGGQMMHDIQMMAMSFNFYQEVDLSTARKLLIDSVQEYLSDINSNDKIRKYLHNYPFTDKNVEIVIFFHSPDGFKVSPGKINIAAANQGKVTYYIDYPEKHTIKSIYKETYEEASQAVSSQ